MTDEQERRAAETARFIRSEQIEGRLIGPAFHAYMNDVEDEQGSEFSHAVRAAFSG